MKEKKYVVVLLVFMMSLACTAWAYDLPLINGDFELPGTVKIGGWDNVEEDIPGWTSDGLAIESGVETGWADPITGGDWSGFIFNGDPTVYNICDFAVLPHRTYTLYIDAQDNWTDSGPALLNVSLFYGTAVSRTEIVSTTLDLPDSWDTYTLSFDVADYPAAVGQD